MKEMKSFNSPEQAIQYVIDRLEKENGELSQRLLASETLMRFLIRAIEDVHPDIRDALLTMIHDWHKGCLGNTDNQVRREELHSAFDYLAAEMKNKVELKGNQPPSFEVVLGGKDAT